MEVEAMLTVNNGTGSGIYPEGVVVLIAARPPAGKVFYKWTGDTGTLANVRASSTMVRVHRDLTVTATFTPATPHALEPFQLQRQSAGWSFHHAPNPDL
jgi:uncharacterized repeat protein (TIGR02543 family)